MAAGHFQPPLLGRAACAPLLGFRVRVWGLGAEGCCCEGFEGPVVPESVAKRFQASAFLLLGSLHPSFFQDCVS